MEFKGSDGSTTITAHDTMRVDYAVVSGGCALSTTSGAASSGVVSSSVAVTGVYQSCVLSFTAYFGTTGTDSATMANPTPLTRMVSASRVVFDTELAVSPLVAGVSNTFKRESPYCRDFGAA